MRALPERELQRWRRYWDEEPWGSWRDNMHAAIITSTLIKPHVKKGVEVDPMLYMLEHAERRRLRSVALSQRYMELSARRAQRAAQKPQKPRKPR